MSEQIFKSSPVAAGERISVNNNRPISIKAVVSGFGCGGSVEIGLSPGQFFTIVSGGTALTVEIQDIDAGEIQHPGAVITDALHNLH